MIAMMIKDAQCWAKADAKRAKRAKGARRLSLSSGAKDGLLRGRRRQDRHVSAMEVDEGGDGKAAKLPMPERREEEKEKGKRRADAAKTMTECLRSRGDGNDDERQELLMEPLSGGGLSGERKEEGGGRKSGREKRRGKN